MANGHDQGSDLFANAGFWEWAIGLAWSAGVGVALFLWRLTTRVTILEYRAIKSDEDSERRHQENRDLLIGMQKRLDALTFFIANGRKPPFEE